jgi:seryl-tRNA synthetase
MAKEKGNNPDNRSRTQIVQVRLTGTEKHQLETLVQASATKSKSDLIRSWICHQFSTQTFSSQYSVDPALLETLSRFIQEINRIGCNYNQMAKQVNQAKMQGEDFPQEALMNLNGIKEQLEQMKEQLRELVSRNGGGKD